MNPRHRPAARRLDPRSAAVSRGNAGAHRIPEGPMMTESMPEMITIEKEKVQALFDLVANSMDFGSGFLEKSDVDMLREVATIIGVDVDKATPYDMTRKYPHLWRQDCAFSYRNCGKPQNDPIHQIELPK